MTMDLTDTSKPGLVICSDANVYDGKLMVRVKYLPRKRRVPLLLQPKPQPIELTFFEVHGRRLVEFDPPKSLVKQTETAFRESFLFGQRLFTLGVYRRNPIF